MPKITFVEPDGNVRSVDVSHGLSAMEGAIQYNIEGIPAECGGSCSCSTCHVYVDLAWMAKVGEPSDMERSTLEFAPEVKPNSRLSCQIKLTDDMDGLRLEVAPSD